MDLPTQQLPRCHGHTSQEQQGPKVGSTAEPTKMKTARYAVIRCRDRTKEEGHQLCCPATRKSQTLGQGRGRVLETSRCGSSTNEKQPKSGLTQLIGGLDKGSKPDGLSPLMNRARSGPIGPDLEDVFG